MKKLTAIVIGAGGRGRIYTKIMKELEGKFELVGVAEPIEQSVNYELEKFPNVPKENIYDTWEKILDRPKFADFAIIATQDHMHTEPALKAIELGYDILLEKPIAPTAEECKKIAMAAKEKGVKVLVCHVLRYAPKFMRIKEIIESGKIGEVMSIQALESVGNRHMAHSFVRGAWGNSDTSCPMILAKCCHDTDIIQWLMGKKCTRVHSFGNLSFFNKEHQPEGAPSRCTEDCPHREECIYDVKKMYIENQYMGSAWFKDAAAGFPNATDEEVWEAIQKNNYGTCIFEANNNVVDHQVVNMEFEGGATATLNMNCFNKGGRIIHIYGTKGELSASMGTNVIKVYSFETNKTEEYDLEKIGQDITSGHGGGDDGIIGAFYDMLNGKEVSVMGDISVSVKNHMIAFAAEKSRLEGRVVEVSEFYK